jgi:4a-hydroxytetrahydrobiopterin dehydratase
MAKRKPLKVYTDAEVLALLKNDLRHWRLDEGRLCRTYRTDGWKGTMMAANAVAHLAEMAWHHPELRATYPALDVRLDTHEADGITDRDLELAARIEALLQWLPAREGGALEGTPRDQAYIVRDD